MGVPDDESTASAGGSAASKTPQPDPADSTDSIPVPKPGSDIEESRTLTFVDWAERDDAETDSAKRDSSTPGAGPRVVLGSSEDRYHMERFVGAGGMGEVYRGRDQLLSRQVAIKFLHSEQATSRHACEQFWNEAVTSSGLGHPAIPPIHDVGLDRDGRPFYVMQLIEGESLREILARKGDQGWRLPRRLSAFLQVCGAVQFAHDRNLLHLDIKPDNVMVGDYGDVYLVDWGLAESVKAAEAGVKRGTPAYMSPEQTTGARASTASDIFSLGALLYELAVGNRAFRSAQSETLLERVRSAQFEKGPNWTQTPEELREIIGDALHLNPTDRVPTARSLAERVQAFIDGRNEEQRKQREARQRFKEAAAVMEELELNEREHRSLFEKIAQHNHPTWAAADQKSELWHLEYEIERREIERDALSEKAYRLLTHVLEYDPNHEDARRQCGELLWPRFEAAEASDDRFQRQFLKSQLSELGLPEIDRRIRGDGTLFITTSPPAERFLLSPVVEENYRLVATDPKEIETPHGESIAMGSYVATLLRAGYEDLTVPIHIGRLEDVVLDLTFRTRSAVGPGFLTIPAGSFLMGGDTQTLKSVSRQVVHVDEFAIARFPVTFEEYREFLQSVADDRPEDLPALVPTFNVDGEPAWSCQPDPSGGDHPIQVTYGRFEDEGAAYREWPVFCVNYSQALSYCRWRSERDQRQYDLPRDEEWEKAARGTDGRRFPWGPRYDASFCKNSGSTENIAQPEPIGSYPTDVSPYGVRDLAGGIREWCSSWMNEKDGGRLVRGGSWNFGSIAAHCAYRLGCHENEAYPFIGFRLVHRFEKDRTTTTDQAAE